MKTKIRGVVAHMNTFDFYYGIRLGELILTHSDNLSKTLQSATMSATEGQKVAEMTVTAIIGIRDKFGRFWESVTADAASLQLEDPTVPRPRKRPRRLETGDASPFHPSTAEDHYRLMYVDAIDNITSCIQDRFNQPGYRQYRKLQDLLLYAVNGNDFESLLKEVTAFYGSDFDSESTLRLHLNILKEQCQGKKDITFEEIRSYVTHDLSPGQKALISNAVTLLKLILVMPATNATSERMFSSLRRVKTYLRGL
ncbi:zinc finger MYM-type protein 1-like [Amphiura filiformis]|uniref:zinc finger MYM-type protein 1-like n=1 Tax=Amphiura filiformis TaxID=82378 RepID=UPI003B222FD3